MLSLVLLFSLALYGMNWVNGQIRPLLKAMAITHVGNAVAAAVNNAVSTGIVDHHITYEDMVEIETDSTGNVTVLKSNMTKINLLRAELLAIVLEEVAGLSEEEFSIPLGSLTDMDLLHGRGPNVAVRIHAAGAANASFQHEFTTAGVNQTLHQIMLAIDVTVQILLPGETAQVVVPTKVCVAETVIVGVVPETYLQLENEGT